MMKKVLLPQAVRYLFGIFLIAIKSINTSLLNFLTALTLPFALLACAASVPTDPTGQPLASASPVAQTALRLEQRAAQAFAQSDWVAAEADYANAASIYASVALTDAELRAWLSVARVQAEAGQSATALALVQAVLKRIDKAGVQTHWAISDATRLIAHGRAAGLLLVSDTKAAQGHWAQAQALCPPKCPQAASLAVLQARIALQRGEASAALAAASAALALKPALAELANARRVRAYAALALGDATAARDDALAALDADQRLGLSAKVVDDLRTVASAYHALGDKVQQDYYQALLDRTLEARKALHPAPLPVAAHAPV
jgi:tetratricopeptide (TPR) repeat protein